MLVKCVDLSSDNCQVIKLATHNPSLDGISFYYTVLENRIMGEAAMDNNYSVGSGVSSVSSWDYVLNYFPITALAEACRMTFHLKQVRFRDNQIPFNDWFAPDSCYKKDVKRFPLGKVPTLEINGGGTVICQHQAILHYLANEFDLYGSSSEEKAVVDQVIETVREIFDDLEPVMTNESWNEQEKGQAYAAFFAADRLKFSFLENSLQLKEGKFFLGNKISVADLYFYQVIEYLAGCRPKSLDPYPALRQLKHDVENVDEIAKYLSIRKHRVFIGMES